MNHPIECPVFVFLVELLTEHNLLADQGDHCQVQIVLFCIHIPLFVHAHKFREQQLREDYLVEESLQVLEFDIPELPDTVPFELIDDVLYFAGKIFMVCYYLVHEQSSHRFQLLSVGEHFLPHKPRKSQVQGRCD